MINITQPISYNSPKFELSRLYCNSLSELTAKSIALYPEYYTVNVAGTFYLKKGEEWVKYTPDLGDLVSEKQIIVNSANNSLQDYTIRLGTSATNVTNVSNTGVSIHNTNDIGRYAANNWCIYGTGGEIKASVTDTDACLYINNTLKFTQDSIYHEISTATLTFPTESSKVGDHIVFNTNGGVVDLDTISSTSGDYLPLSGGTVTGSVNINNTLLVAGDLIVSNVCAVDSTAGIAIQDVLGIVATENERSSTKVFATDGSIVELSTGTSGDYLPLSGGTVTGNTTFTEDLQVGTTNNVSISDCFIDIKNSLASHSILLNETDKENLYIIRSNENRNNYSDSPLLILRSLAEKYIKIDSIFNESADKVFATDGSLKDLSSYAELQKLAKALVTNITAGKLPYLSTDESEVCQFTNTLITNSEVAENLGTFDNINKVLYLLLPTMRFMDYYQLKNIAITITVTVGTSTKLMYMLDIDSKIIEQVNVFDYTEYNKPITINTNLNDNAIVPSEGATIKATLSYEFANFTLPDITAITYARRLVWAGCSESNDEVVDYLLLDDPSKKAIMHLKPYQSVKTVVWQGIQGQYAYVTVPSEWSLPTNGEILTYLVSGSGGTPTKYGCVKVDSITLYSDEALKLREYTTYRSTSVIANNEDIQITFN